MKIALLGYGKMGKAIEQIALSRNHEISFRLGSSNLEDIDNITKENTDVIIEFSNPHSVINNIHSSLNKNIPIIVGTTGWNDHIAVIEDKVKKVNGTLLHSSNFSIGVNIFFEMNKKLAQIMSNYSEYEVSMMEAHHLQKLDSPSGTAITIAEGIIENHAGKNSWIESNTPAKKEIGINALRQPEVYGTHLVNYESSIDKIEIKHVAKNRNGFAQGAVVAAEWIKGKTGIFTMKDVLEL